MLINDNLDVLLSTELLQNTIDNSDSNTDMQVNDHRFSLKRIIKLLLFAQSKLKDL